MNQLAKFLMRNAYAVIVVFLVLTLLLANSAIHIKTDNSAASLYPDKSAVNEISREIAETFSQKERLLLVAHGDIFTREGLSRVRTLSNKLQQLPGSQGVTSLATGKRMSDDNGFLLMDSLIPADPSPADIESMKEFLFTSPMYENVTLVNSEGTSASFIIELENDIDNTAFAREVVHAVETYWGTDYALAGQAFTTMELQEIIGRDLPILGGLALAAIVIMLFLNFRSVPGTAVSLIQIITSVIWGMGLFQLLGFKIMALTVIGPIAVMAVGSSFAINMLGRYYFELSHGATKATAITNMLSETGLGVIISGIAISAAMSTFMLSGLQMVRGLGLIAVLGVLAALLATMTLLPALLSVLPVPKQASSQRKPGIIARFLKALGHVVINNRTVILIFAAIMAFVSILGIPRIENDTSILAFFPPDGHTRASVAAVEDTLGGSATISIWVEGDVTNPQLLTAMRDFQDDVSAIPEIGPGQSVANLVAALHQTLTGETGLPDSTEAIAQELLIYQVSGGVDELARFVTLDYQQALINFVVKSVSTERVAGITDEISELADAHFGSLAQIKITGTPLLEREIELTMRKDFLMSLSLAIILVLFVDSFVRSIRAAAVTILVLLITVALQYGILGWFGIPLNLATMLMGALAIGVGDYAIHLTVRYMEERRVGYDPESAMERTIGSAGKQIFFTAVTLGAGFGALSFANFVPVATLGNLMLFTVVLVGLATLTLLPAASLVLLRNPHSKIKQKGARHA